MDYPVEVLDDNDDDGTMVESLTALTDAVIGHKIISAERTGESSWSPFIITLDDGRKVQMTGNGDCCAYTDLESFLLHPELVDHAITGVGTTDGYTKWHIYADLGDVLELEVGWSCGNPFYYGYGFDIAVSEVPE